MSHEERIEIAARLRDRILQVYGDSVLTVFVTSSTAKRTQKEADFSRALHLALTMVVESRDKIRNAALAGDELNIRVTAFRLAEDAANFVLLLNRHYMVTSRRFFEQAFECPETPANFRRLVELLIGTSAAAVSEIATAAEQLSMALLYMATSNDITVESKDLLV